MSNKEPNILILGYFLSEDKLLNAVHELRNKDLVIKNVCTPFPVHGLPEALGLKKSRIPTIGFVFGALGALVAFLFQSWVFTKSYPMNIGGKPLLSIPTFIPVTFEISILFAATAMVFAFLIRSRLGLGARDKVYDPKVSDDHFLIILVGDNPEQTESLKVELKNLGALEVREVESNKPNQ